MGKTKSDAHNRIWNCRRGNFLKLVLDELNLNWLIKNKIAEDAKRRCQELKQGIRYKFKSLLNRLESWN